MSSICIQCKVQITKSKQKNPVVLNLSNSKIQHHAATTIAEKFCRRQLLAEAGVLQDLGRKYIRAGEELDPLDAVQQLIRAEKTLESLKMIAEIPQDSDLRRKYEAYYPGMAKQIRQLESAVPLIVNSVNQQGEDNLSVKYGGNVAAGKGVVDQLFEALGEILTISGRTIKDEARVNPVVVQTAIDELNIIIKMVPPTLMAQASNDQNQKSM